MEAVKFQIIETIGLILLIIVLRWTFFRITERVAIKFNYHSSRVKILTKIVSLLIYIIAFSILVMIWGIEQSKLLIFVSSSLTILAIAFVAQWSIISNITAAIVIYFNHPVRIGDMITVLDKDYSIEGKVSDIGIFFIILKTKEGEEITMPNNVFIQKLIMRKNKL